MASYANLDALVSGLDLALVRPRLAWPGTGSDRL